MKKIAILGAMEIEIKPLLEKLLKYNPFSLKWHSLDKSKLSNAMHKKS